MSHYDYQMSKEITKHDYPFFAIIMAAMRKADSRNLDALKYGFPKTWAELQERYNAPGGFLKGEETESESE